MVPATVILIFISVIIHLHLKMGDNETPSINHGCVDHLPESDIERKREPY